MRIAGCAMRLSTMANYKWDVFIPPFSFTTDNAAMICQAGYFKYLDNDFCAIDEVPFAKTRI